jgi:hypothetical protein
MAERDQNGRFLKGMGSGNPAGRPKGTVLAATAVRRMIEEALPEIIAKQIEIAKRGNTLVARTLLEKILPAARSAPISGSVPLDGTPTEQAERVASLMANGQITLEEGAALISAVAATQSIRDASELQRRLAEIETKLAALSGGAAPPPPALPPPGDTDASS